MQKTIFLIISSLILSFSVKSQSISESINQINIQLLDAVFDYPPNLVQIYYTYPARTGSDKIWYKTKLKLKLFGKGNLAIYKTTDRYLIPKGIHPSELETRPPVVTKLFQEQSYYVQLGKLNDTVDIEIEAYVAAKNDTISVYHVVLCCQDNNICISNKNMGEGVQSCFNIPVINKKHAISLKRAFEKLIKYVKENPDL